ncbi:RTA1 like protein-domain-containing protein [Tricharina praecox]|uniref:RTA1 like protein-domain-containing protein n=1 Tax=Tricharina praecox TaxID=43433 RepID=UPI00221FA7D5|nr:RTA1 like protein-domain-containing protein [Tricharina praecox]KAI5850149.1 RTA1 like protein-domain-containing protein [Tricharina praecox]
MSTEVVPQKYVFYYYTPSIVAAAIFAVIFALTTIAHGFQLIRSRTWYFIPMFIGALMEAIGYVGRIMSHSDKENLGPYIMQSLLLLVAPALFAASIYMVLGRLIAYLDAAHHSMIRLNWLTKFFVLGDVLSFMMQGGGGGMMAKATEESADLGQKLILGGLFVQLLFFGGFVVVAIRFHTQIVREPTVLASSLQTGGKNGWLTLLRVLYGASALIMVRSIFRVVEYIQGNKGYLMRNEVWLYIFDAVLMAAAVFLFNLVHPSNVILSEDRKGYTGGEAGLQDVEMQRHHGGRKHRDSENRQRR